MEYDLNLEHDLPEAFDACELPTLLDLPACVIARELQEVQS